MADAGIKHHYFGPTDRVSPDDDVHHAAIAAGELPERCRLGGPSITLIRLAAQSADKRICDLCPFPHRHVCGGTPVDQATKKISLDETELAAMMQATEARNLKLKRDLARAKIQNGLLEADTRRKKTP